MENIIGTEKGELCNRDGCMGIIDEHESDSGCSCHLNPPCSYCTDSRLYCPECDWDGREEQIDKQNAYDANQTPYTPKPYVLDNTKIDYHIKGHTNSSQICEGVYPEGTTRDQVEQRVKGSWGGRFEHFGNGKFKYIAYTD